MKRGPVLSSALLVVAVTLASCDVSGSVEVTTSQATASPAGNTTATSGATVPGTSAVPPADLIVWTDDLHAIALDSIVPAFEQESGVNVIVELVDFAATRDQVRVAGLAGEGPDIFIGSSDWVGDLAGQGLLEPLDLGERTQEFTRSSTSALTYNGTLYGLPYAAEAVAMYFNTDLAPEAPITMDDAAAACATMRNITNCIGLPGGDLGTVAYHQYPFLTAAGGYIFGVTDEGYDVTDVGLDSAGSIAGAQALEALITGGAIGSTSYDSAKSQFLNGTEPFWITGPWELGSVTNQDTVNWSVAKLPRIAGGTPRPFVGVQAFFLTSFSENKLVAQAFLLNVVATEQGMTALYAVDGRPPVHKAIISAVADDPVMSAFTSSATDGVPIPNIPAMSSVWAPLGSNLLLLGDGGIDGETAMINTARTVREVVDQ